MSATTPRNKSLALWTRYSQEPLTTAAPVKPNPRWTHRRQPIGRGLALRGAWGSRTPASWATDCSWVDQRRPENAMNMASPAAPTGTRKSTSVNPASRKKPPHVRDHQLALRIDCHGIRVEHCVAAARLHPRRAASASAHRWGPVGLISRWRALVPSPTERQPEHVFAAETIGPIRSRAGHTLWRPGLDNAGRAFRPEVNVARCRPCLSAEAAEGRSQRGRRPGFRCAEERTLLPFHRGR